MCTTFSGRGQWWAHRAVPRKHLTTHVQSAVALPGCVAVSQGFFRIRHCGRWSRGRSIVRPLRAYHPSVVPGVEEADAGWSRLAHVRPLCPSSPPTAVPGKVMRTSMGGEKTSVILRERHRCALDSWTSRPPRHTIRNMCTRVRVNW